MASIRCWRLQFQSSRICFRFRLGKSAENYSSAVQNIAAVASDLQLGTALVDSRFLLEVLVQKTLSTEIWVLFGAYFVVLLLISALMLQNIISALIVFISYALVTVSAKCWKGQHSLIWYLPDGRRELPGPNLLSAEDSQSSHCFFSLLAHNPTYVVSNLRITAENFRFSSGHGKVFTRGLGTMFCYHNMQKKRNFPNWLHL